MGGFLQNVGAPSFVLTYDAEGAVLISVKAMAYIPQCSFFKVTYGYTGFVAIPFESKVDEFFVGWSAKAMSVGSERVIRIGGYIEPVLTTGGDSDWLVFLDGSVAPVQSPIRPANSFGYKIGADRAMLFPVMVRKEKE